MGRGKRKNSSFFLQLEKKNYVNKHITQLNVEGINIDNPKQILKEQKKFYETLYSEKDVTDETEENMNHLISMVNTPKLTENQKEHCELKVSIHECAKALKELKNGKSPGIDGIPADFYKFFWLDVQNYVVESINYSFTSGKMSTSQRLAVITLLPKKDKDRLLLKNWRPVSLLSTDYKLITKMLAMKLSSVLSDLIHHDQTAYIKGRYIGENIRTIDNAIEYCKQNNMSAILLLIDFEKAFDTIRWKFLMKVLKKFNFGNVFKRWIKIIYNEIQSTVMNNGYFSPYFNIYRGMRQGCPISAYLFIMIVEILATSIRNNKQIHGLKLKTREIKISQLADDTTIFLNSIESLQPVKDTLREFHICSGLRPNMDKTQAFIIGKHIRFKNTYNLTWCEGPINTLGVSICQSPEDNYRYNYEPKIKKIKTILSMWKQRRLSLKGKITVLNTLAISILVYPCTNLETPDRVITEIDHLFFDFLWDGGNNKIAKNTIIQQIEKGGLKMIDIESKIKSLKLSWMKRALTNPFAAWKLIIDELLTSISFDDLIKCRYNGKNFINRLPKFYKGIVQIWNEINDFNPTTIQPIIQEPLWHNKYITIENNTILWTRWQEKGIKQIHHLLNIDNQFLTCEQLKAKYNLSCNFLDHLRIRQAIPINWRGMLSPPLTNKSGDLHTTPKLYITVNEIDVDIIQAPTNTLYWLLIHKKTHRRVPTCIQRWETIYNIDNSIWHSIFKSPFKSCRETYLQSFQYRIIHRILPCNVWLVKRKIVESDKCTYRYCEGHETDTIIHYLVGCKLVQNFWQSFVAWWNAMNFSKLYPLVEENIILGFPCVTNEDIILNFCIILAKYHIYTAKRNQNIVFFLDYLKELKHKLVIEEAIHVKNFTENKFYDIWGYLVEQL